MILKNKKNKGFTLVELLVYISISSVIILAVFTFVISLMQTQSKITLERETWENAQRSMDRIVRELQKATSIDESSSIFGTNPGDLHFDTYSYESDDIIPTRVYLSNNKIFLQTSAGDELMTSSEVEATNLTFNLFTSASGTISIQTIITVEDEKKVVGKNFNASTTITRSVTLRN